jgi:rhamnogalacturonan endolyase
MKPVLSFLKSKKMKTTIHSWMRFGYKTIFVFLFSYLLVGTAQAQYQMENLSRGLVAVSLGGSKVFLSWRLMGTEFDNTTFNVYRNGTKLTSTPISVSNYTDNAGSATASYTVRGVINGIEQPVSKAVTPWAQQYLDIPLKVPAGGTSPDGVAYTYSANDCSVADLDGDSEYEIVVKWDPSNSKDNSASGYAGNCILDAYEFDGTQLWRINLGINIRAGAHYTQFQVYDLDGDGKAEMACKTGDGTVDGVGQVIGTASADHRNSSGYILSGPEYLTVFEGKTGKALVTTNYTPARGDVSAWGGVGGNGGNDSYGNRVDRFLSCVAYLDGQHPSLIMCRGYYGRSVLSAWDYRGGKLTQRWIFDSSVSGLSKFSGQGSHAVSVADVDEDGKQEIVYGAMCVDDNGQGLYSTGYRHGDALHVSDLDPSRAGLEIYMIHENEGTALSSPGSELHDAKTGALIWETPIGTDVGRGVGENVDPTNPGAEFWGTGTLFNVSGKAVSGAGNPSMVNFATWWDGDLTRELLDKTMINKYARTGETRLLTASGVSSNNSTKATPNLSADILGDWREEAIWRTTDSKALRVYTTTIATTNRLFTLLHDPQYRVAVAWQNVGYNQPPHPSFYMGDDMKPVTKPNIVIIGGSSIVTDIEEAENTTSANKVVCAPNPFTQELHVSTSGSFTYSVFNMAGNLVESGTGQETVTIASTLPSGMYIVKIATAGSTTHQKVTKY